MVGSGWDVWLGGGVLWLGCQPEAWVVQADPKPWCLRWPQSCTAGSSFSLLGLSAAAHSEVASRSHDCLAC